MIRIKVFTERDADRLEASVNDYLEAIGEHADADAPPPQIYITYTTNSVSRSSYNSGELVVQHSALIEVNA